MKGTCLQTYIPMRSEPRPGAEMVSSLIFGENYEVIEQTDDWLKIRTDFDHYEGWISANAFHAEENFTRMIDTDFAEAYTKGEKIYIPCGGLVPDSGKILIGGKTYELKANLKPSHHLPLPIRLANTAKSLLNAPYLWGGRCFMGIDCSGFTQVVFKANGLTLPRDTKQQIHEGREVEFEALQTGDLVFFSKHGKENVSHVGMMLNAREIIHASGRVKIETLNEEGLFADGQQVYRTIALRRMLN